MYLSMKLGICLQTQFLFSPFYIPSILQLMSGNHGASLAGHLGLTGSVPSCLGEGVPPPYPHRQHRRLAKRGLASWMLGDGCCGSRGVQIWLGKAGTLGSDWEKEYILHPEKGWRGSSVGVCSPFSFLFGVAHGTENAIFSLLKANLESSYFVPCKSRASWLGVQIARNLPYSLL